MPFLEHRGVRLHYEVEGQGPALVFHTGAGGDARLWREAGYVRGLPGFRCLLFDQRGRGESGRPDGLEEHRMPCYSGDVLALLDHLGVERAAFWGYSSGTMVGVDLAAHHPARVAALLGTGAVELGDRTELDLPRDAAAVATAMAERPIAKILGEFEQEEQFAFPEPIRGNVLATDDRMLALSRVGWRTWKGPESLYPRVQAPTLFLVGSVEDPERTTEKAAKLLPRGRCHYLPGIGHQEVFVRSERVLPIALPFLQRAFGAP